MAEVWDQTLYLISLTIVLQIIPKVLLRVGMTIPFCLITYHLQMFVESYCLWIIHLAKPWMVMLLKPSNWKNKNSVS